MTREATARFGEAVRKVLLAEEEHNLAGALPYLRWMWKIDVIDNPEGSTSVMRKRILVTNGRDSWATCHLPNLVCLTLREYESSKVANQILGTEHSVSLASLLLATETTGSAAVLSASSWSRSEASADWAARSLSEEPFTREFIYSCLYNAVCMGRSDTVAVLLSNLDSDVEQPYLHHLLSISMQSKAMDTAELLLSVGADANYRPTSRNCLRFYSSYPLHGVCLYPTSSPDAANILLMSGANAFQRDSKGRTALQVVQNPRTRVVLEAGVTATVPQFIRHTRSARRLFQGGNLIIDAARAWYVPTFANVVTFVADVVQGAAYCTLSTYSPLARYTALTSMAYSLYVAHIYPLFPTKFSAYIHTLSGYDMLSGYALDTLNPLISIQATLLKAVAVGTIISTVWTGLIFMQNAVTFAHEFPTCEFDRNSHEAWANVCKQLSLIVPLDRLNDCVKSNLDMAISACQPDTVTEEPPDNFVYMDSTLPNDVTYNITLAGAT